MVLEPVVDRGLPGFQQDARVTAGLDVEPEANIETREVDAASNTNEVVNDDADHGVVQNGEDDKLPELTLRYKEIYRDSDNEEDSVRNSNVKEENVNDEESDEDSVDNEEPVEPPTVQRTSSGRITRPPNSFIPTMTGKPHGNSCGVE